MVTLNVEEERRKIDSRIQELLVQISDLHTRWNSFSIVSHLPAELMVNIFVYARNFSSIKSRSKTAMSISWVCRRWRQVAIDWPPLWTDIDFDHGSGIEQFLTRSLALPLYLWVSLDEVTPSLFHHTGRFREFNRIPQAQDAENPRRVYLDLDEYWVDSSPNLESLTLTNATVPASLSKDTPPLSQLSFTEFRIDWNLPIFSDHLTTLSLTRPVQKIFVLELLDVFAKTPALQYLTLNNALQSTPNFPQLQIFIELLALESMSIHETSSLTLRHLFDHLKIPGYIDANFTFDFDHSSNNGTSVLAPYHAARIDPPAIVGMDIGRDSRVFTLDTSEEWPGSDEICETSIVTLSTGNIKPLDLPQNLDLTTLKSLRLRYTQDHYTNRHEVDPQDWSRVLGGLPNLSALTVEGGAAFSFLHYLAEEGEEAKYNYKDMLPESLRPTGELPFRFAYIRMYRTPGSANAPKELQFKALRELSLNFRYDNGDEGDFDRYRIDFNNLLYDLCIRKELGFGLTKLEYQGWQISENNLSGLKELVVRVENADEHSVAYSVEE